MRSLFLLAALCCLVLSVCGGPLVRQEDEQTKQVAVGRQAATPTQAAASDDDDDDDDDDDEDDVFGGDDSDDDDDEEEEDDDVFENFIEGILGGGDEDDDDDDDEDTPTPSVQPVVAPADSVAAASNPVAAVEEAAVAGEEAAGSAEGEVAAEGEEAVAAAGQKEPASAEAEVPAPAPVEAAADAEDDDDEEEDDITDAFEPEDDEEEDDEDDDDDDGDDDDDDDLTDLGRNTSGKQARALKEENPKKPPMPAIYIVKYNRFVDNVFYKMNDILKRSYDPVNVKLQPIDANKKSSKPKKNKNKSKKRKTNKKKNVARAGIEDKINETTPTNVQEQLEPENTQANKDESLNKVIDGIENVTSEGRAKKDKPQTTKAKPAAVTTKPPKKTTKPKPPVKTKTKAPAKPNKVKTSEKNRPKAKGTLYGLSSLRRVGDVVVNVLANQTTVKSNFAVGPLILRVEKEVNRGAKKELKSATATTAEMSGKLILKVNNKGIATLHSIRVLQPKQVRVDSNHERTRELVWRRSARIAHMVSEKLLTASKPMFRHNKNVNNQ